MIQGSGPFRAKRQKPSRPFHAIFKITVGNRRDRSMLQPLKNGYSPEPSATVRNRSWKLRKRYSVGTVATVPRCIQDYSQEPSRPFPQNWILAFFSLNISIYIYIYLSIYIYLYNYIYTYLFCIRICVYIQLHTYNFYICFLYTIHY